MLAIRYTLHNKERQGTEKSQRLSSQVPRQKIEVVQSDTIKGCADRVACWRDPKSGPLDLMTDCERDALCRSTNGHNVLVSCTARFQTKRKRKTPLKKRKTRLDMLTGKVAGRYAVSGEGPLRAKALNEGLEEFSSKNFEKRKSVRCILTYI